MLSGRVMGSAGLATALVVVTAESASAQTAVGSSVPFALAGPVGFVAVALGVGGVVVGLLRRRKVAAAVRRAAAVPLPAPRVAEVDQPVG